MWRTHIIGSAGCLAYTVRVAMDKHQHTGQALYGKSIDEGIHTFKLGDTWIPHTTQFNSVIGTAAFSAIILLLR